jgi:hypothetical protein
MYINVLSKAPAKMVVNFYEWHFEEESGFNFKYLKGNCGENISFEKVPHDN